jgi:tetratricopeptide (TPR) repeat protein
VNRYYLPVIPLLGIVTTVTLQTQPVFALERSEIAARVKEFTVQIDGEETGTGTIIEQNGNTYRVLTCWHVLDTPGNYKIIAPDGQEYQATQIKNLPDADLATIEFTSSKTYPTAELVNSQTITEGTSIYVVGYPDAIPGIPERTYTFLDAAVVSQLTKSEKGYTIIHDNPSTPGGSGGGMFDSNGSLVGVNGTFISDANTTKVYGAGIPLQVYVATRTDLVVPTNVTPPQDFVSVGKRKLKAKDYQGAIIEFNQALADNPNDIDALAGRAETYYRLKNFSAAIQDFDAILQRNFNNATFFFYRGNAHNHLKEHNIAIADYNEAIRLNPEYAKAYNNRGFSYHILGENQKAIADYNEAIRLNPKLAKVYFNRGISYSDLGENQKAIADHTEAIRLNPKLAEAYYNRGISYSDLGEYNIAIADHTEAIRLNPKLAKAYVNRGASYYALGEHNIAIADYNEAIRLNPELAGAYVTRGGSYYALGDKIKAIEDLQKAANLLEQQGDVENYQKVLSLIEELE